MTDITPFDARKAIPNPWEWHKFYPIPNTPWSVSTYRGRGKQARSRYLMIRRPITRRIVTKDTQGNVLREHTEQAYQEFRADMSDPKPAWQYIDTWMGKATYWMVDSIPANPNNA